MSTALWAAGLVVMECIIGAYGAMLLKLAAPKLKFNLMSILRNRELALGFACYGIATILFMIALRGGELSVLYPLVGTNYVWICLFSQKFLNEKMNALKWTGIVSILLGVGLIGIGV